MKKILLTFALVGFVFAANAQLVISANVGGSSTSSSTSTTTKISIQGDSTYVTNGLPLKETSWTAGLKVGYKIKRLQLGVSGSYTSATASNQPIDSTILPYYGTKNKNKQLTSLTGLSEYMSSTTTSMTIAPYFRYDVIQAGDVALFLELSGFYTKVNDPTVRAHYEIVWGESKFSGDTNFTRILNSTGWGVKLTPGLSWQLSKHCGIDLYFDFASIAYSSIKTTALTCEFERSSTTEGTTTPGYRKTHDITSNTEGTVFGGLFNGTPLLTALNEHNWVRVGFNFTF